MVVWPTIKVILLWFYILLWFVSLWLLLSLNFTLIFLLWTNLGYFVFFGLLPESGILQISGNGIISTIFYCSFIRSFLRGFSLRTSLKNRRKFLSLHLLKRKKHQRKNLFQNYLLPKRSHSPPKPRWLILVIYWWVKEWLYSVISTLTQSRYLYSVPEYLTYFILFTW
jgi:hypothetical protein